VLLRKPPIFGIILEGVISGVLLSLVSK
jgi:hypothetical protein